MTPTALKGPVLRAIGDMTNLHSEVEVRAQEVIAKALGIAGVAESDVDYTTSYANAHWAATRMLRRQGLLALGSRRGLWRLTPEGIVTVKHLLGGGALPTSEVPSAWEEDPAGVCVDLEPMSDAYPDDPYIRSLAIARTPCYGHHDPEEEVCQNCPLVGSCKANRLVAVRASVERVRRESLPPPHPNLSAQGRGTAYNADLQDIVATLEQKEKIAITMRSTGKCFVCDVALAVGARAISAPGRGVHCQGCTPH